MYFEVMTGDDHEQFCKAMVSEIIELEQKNSWTLTKCSDMVKQGQTALSSTWAFHHK